MPSPRRRLIEALLVSVPFALITVYVSPLARSMGGPVIDTPALLSDTSARSRDPIEVGPGYEQTFGATTRLCRYRGTEWEVSVQSVEIPASDAINKALTAPQFRLIPLEPSAIDTGMAGESQTALMESAVRFGQIAAGQPAISGESKAILAGETSDGPPLAILISFPAGDGRTVLVTMKLSDRNQLLKLVTPPNMDAMRAGLEQVIPIFPGSTLMDMIENETSREILTNYILTQSTPEWEAAEHYEKAVAGIETFAEGDISRIVFQTFRQDDVTVYLAHYPGETPGSSQTIVKVWRKTPSA